MTPLSEFLALKQELGDQRTFWHLSCTTHYVNSDTYWIDCRETHKFLGGKSPDDSPIGSHVRHNLTQYYEEHRKVSGFWVSYLVLAAGKQMILSV